MIREETLMADIDEILMSTEERMEKAITALKENFMGVRTGRANAWCSTASRWTTTACPRR